MHHAMMTILRTHGEFLGCLPVWRGPTMGPFDRSDARFLSAAAPHIAHGLGNAYRFSSTIVADHGQFLLADSNAVGIALVDQCGRVNALNETAKSIFYEIGVLDGLPADTLAAGRVRTALEYIARTLQAVFANRERDPFRLNVPSIQVLSHHTGITLKLHGTVAEDQAGKQQIVITIERGELAERRRQRFVYRHGLTLRDLRLLHLLGGNLRPREIASAFGVSGESFKSHVRRLVDKLGLADYSALCGFVRANPI
jgi:DNA-binding CsgD family transcriptional regulator